jgi:replicative DNA helicase
MPVDESLIAYAVRYEGLTDLQQAGISREHFVDEFRTVWSYILRTKRDHDTIPSEDTLVGRFPDLQLPNIERRELPLLLAEIRQRHKFIQLLHAINEVADGATNYDVVDELIQNLQGKLNTLAFSQHQQSHLVDLFGREGKRRLLADAKQRRRGDGVVGIPTGLTKFDSIIGGLQKQKMVVAIGRPGIGKSWLDLLLVASAVLAGKKVMLYPLEMTMEETAHRLYTLFTSKMFGAQRALKNHDLTMGRVTVRKMRGFLNVLEDRFAGQLYVADVGSLSDPYTNERIEAEVEMHHPDMFWVDYITLLKPPAGTRGDASDWGMVRQLSNGVKNTAMRRNCVGGCSAQVNREALKNEKIFLPRIENIAYGDSIGQDADLVFSLNRRREYLYYAVVKHRGGPEIGKTKMKFAVNVGVLEEVPDVQEDGDGA